MDKTDETIRQWFRGKTQRLKVNGSTKYLLLAVDEDGEYATNFIFTALLPSNCKSPTKGFPLMHITRKLENLFVNN